MTKSEEIELPWERSDVLYFECHINLSPESDRDTVAKIIKPHHFRLARLYMSKDASELATDCFITGRSNSLSDLKRSTNLIRLSLNKHSIKYHRIKYEAVIEDTRY